MGSRERKRGARRKRKERSTERRTELAERQEERSARTEARNAAVREELEPLEEGERPAPATVGAVLSGLLALGTVIAYAAGVEVGEFDDFGNEIGSVKPSLIQTALSAVVLGAMAYGLWRARYWAVLGFQTLLVLVIVITVLGLVQASNIPRALVFGVLLAGASLFFYRMVKAMARIQMPDRRPPG